MKMRLFFVAGDVGGARALYPVIAEATAQGHAVDMLWHGHLATMPPVDGVQRHQLDPLVAVDRQAAALMATTRPDALVFATSVKDKTALQFAQAARTAGVALAHLLDNWTSYRTRFELADHPLRPELYAVMDQVARQGVLAEGFADDTVLVTGTPALAHLDAATPLPTGPLPLRLVFVSEPVSIDQGDDPSRPSFRGYVESTALSLLASAMADSANAVRIDILPHPREDADRLATIWQSVRGDLAGRIVSPADRDRTLAAAHGIVGMSSILLYEMWLRGWPVASLQPGLRLPELRMLAGKPGLAFIDDAATAVQKLRTWRDGISAYRAPAETAMERVQHSHAAESLLKALGYVVAKHGAERTA